MIENQYIILLKLILENKAPIFYFTAILFKLLSVVMNVVIFAVKPKDAIALYEWSFLSCRHKAR